MSLVRLLAAGKSLMGLRDGSSPYRVTRQRLLPEFGARQNPFRDAERFASMPGGEPPASEAALKLAAEVTAPGLGSLPAGAGLAEPAPPAVATMSQPDTGWGMSRLRLKLSGLFWPRWTKPTPALPRLTRQPVQGELSLDRVRVIRNDLRDADLEVVPRRAVPAPVAVGAPAARTSKQPAAEPVTARTASSRVPLRLFGAGKL